MFYEPSPVLKSLFSGQRTRETLSDSELIMVRAETSYLLSRISKANDSVPFARLDGDLSSIIKSSYGNQRRVSIDNLKSLFNKEEFPSEEEILQTIDESMSTVGSNKKEEIIAAAIIAYLLSRSITAGKDEKPSEYDLSVGASIAADQIYWMDTYYRRMLADSVLTMVHAYVTSDLQTSEKKSGILARLNAILSGTADISGKGDWANRPEEYMTAISKAPIVRGKVFGAVRSFNNNGIQRYRIIHRNGAECEFCQMIDGTEFSVSDGIDLMNKILGAASPEDVKKIVHWKHGPELRMILNSDNPSGTLVSEGLALPPYHPNCTGDIEGIR